MGRGRTKGVAAVLAEPLFWAELVLALACGTVGAVFITTARRVYRRRGLWFWLAGLGVFVLAFIPLVVLLPYREDGYWALAAIAAFVLGRWPAVPLRRWLLREDGPRVEPAVVVER